MGTMGVSYAAIAVAGLVVVAASAASAQGIQHFAVLNGGNEVAAADPDGSGAASVVVRGSQVCFSILVERSGTPVAAHIHEGKSGVNGPIRVPLTPTPAAGNPGTSSGCVPVAVAGLLTRLRNTPNLFYVNLHTTAFPDGAIRGQLF